MEGHSLCDASAAYGSFRRGCAPAETMVVLRLDDSLGWLTLRIPWEDMVRPALP